MEKFDFIGRTYSEQEKEALSKELDARHEHARAPIENELEKTEDDLKIISEINEIMGKELKELGIDEFIPISPNQIHLLTAAEFEKEFPGNASRGLHFSTEKGIYINKDINPSKMKLTATLFHEMVHCVAKTKYYSEEGKIYDARSGYRITSDWKEKDMPHLEGFNELVVDYTTYFWLHKNADSVQEKLALTREDIDGSNYAYMSLGMLMEVIVGDVVKLRQKDDPDQVNTKVLSDLITGQFDNTLLFLKEVDAAFGRGSTKILSKLGANTREEDPELFGKIMDYFMITDKMDKQLRENIRKELGV